MGSVPGRIIVISGPSGAGKSTIVNRLGHANSFFYSVSVTTRPQRAGETEGKDYIFISSDEFDRMVAEGELLEWAKFGLGHRYGTPRQPVLSAQSGGQDVILEMDVDGAKQIKAQFPEALLVFVTPPEITDLEKRLRIRGDTSETDLEWRLARASQDIERAPKLFDVIIINRDLAHTVALLQSLLSSPV